MRACLKAVVLLNPAIPIVYRWLAYSWSYVTKGIRCPKRKTIYQIKYSKLNLHSINYYVEFRNALLLQTHMSDLKEMDKFGLESSMEYPSTDDSMNKQTV